MDKKEKKAGIILAIVAVIFIAIFAVSMKFIDLNSKKGLIIFFSFLLYLPLAFWIGSLTNKKTNKIIKVLIYLFCSPLAVIYVVLKFSYPFISICMNFIFYIVVAFIPTLIIGYLDKLNIIDISYEKLMFLMLTTVSIILVALNKYLLKFVLRYSPVFTKNEGRKDTLELIKLTEYIFNPNNIRFVIYLLYFIFLFLFSLAHLDEKFIFENKLLDNAILQAFLVFLAYDSIRINSKNIKLLPSIILNRMWNVFKYDVTEENNKKENVENKD